jgi:hypothetical protein
MGIVKRVTFGGMLARVHEALAGVPEHRKGRNIQYTIADAGLGAFSVFFTQSPSFLAHQRDMERRRRRNNARSLFGIEQIPSDGQIRNLLDPVDPTHLREPFWEVYRCLDEDGHLERHRGVDGTRLISLDGTQYFSSQEIHCPKCRVTVREEKTYYSHMVMMAVVCAPEQEQVICLDPEFIIPQDGHDKQDCEQQAIKRWVNRNAGRFAPWSVTILADDLHCHQPFCALLLEHKMHFILTCK